MAAKRLVLLCLASAGSVAGQSCWSGFPSGLTATPGMLVLPMTDVICTTTTTGSMTETTSTATTATVTTTSVTDTTKTATDTTTTTGTDTTSTDTTITTSSVTATTTSVTDTTVTTTSVTDTTVTTTSVTDTTVTTTSITDTTITTTSFTATSTSKTDTATTSSTSTGTTVTSTSITDTTTSVTDTTVTSTSATDTSTSKTMTETTTTTATTTSFTMTTSTSSTESMTTTSVSSTITSSTSTTTYFTQCGPEFHLSGYGEEFGGLNRASSSGCNNLAMGATCEVTFDAGSSSDLSACVAPGTYTWFCPNIALTTMELYAQDAYIQCRVCAATFEDTDEQTGNYAGTVTFGPNMLNGTVDESMLVGYLVLPMDDCGHIPMDATSLGSVVKSSTSSNCCENDKYSVNISMPDYAYSRIVVVPSGANNDRLEDGVVIELVDLTTTTTTTMTSTSVTATITTTTETASSTVTTTMTSTAVTATTTNTTTAPADLGDGDASATISGAPPKALWALTLTLACVARRLAAL